MLVELNPHRNLQSHHFMARLLEPDLLEYPLPPPLHSCFFAWRWVAARTFFERGWTLLFERTLRQIKNTREGLAPEELRHIMMEEDVREQPDELFASLVREAQSRWEDPSWLVNQYSGKKSAPLATGCHLGRRSRSGPHRYAPQVLAALNNVVLALFDFLGTANIPQQMRRLEAQPARAVPLVLGSLLTIKSS